MKRLFKNCCVFTLLTFLITGCKKEGAAPLLPFHTAENKAARHFYSCSISNGESFFNDKDKCKKCHPGKSKINWNAPYMSDGRYASIDDVLDNYDFAGNFHLDAGAKNETANVITEKQKQDLAAYLKSIVAASQETDR